MSKVKFLFLCAAAMLITACGADAIQTTVAAVHTDKTATPGQSAPTVVQSATKAAAPTSAPRPTLAADEWKTLPVIPAVSETVIEIYRSGLKLGNDPNAFSKVGDCQVSTDFFLVGFDYPKQYNLGEEYEYLQSTIDYYQGSFSRQSLAVKDGFNVAAVLSSLRADPDQCQKGENPLACEVRLNHPSVVLISMETNFNLQSAEKYGTYMRQIVKYSISQGVVPILATKADNIEGNHSINAEIAAIANEYDIPLWNFWAAAHPLPNNGFDLSLNDGFHLSIGKSYYFDDPANLERAWPVRNLTALQTLDAVRNGLNK